MPNEMQHRLVNALYVASQVVKGFGRGSKELGIPTANLEDDVVHGITLDDGIYYGFAQLLHSPDSPLNSKSQLEQLQQNKGKENEQVVVLDHCPDNPIYPMVCSLGWNPQYNNKTRTLEVHILHDFGYDFYGSLIRIAICGYIRPEMRFESVQKLIDTIHSDIRFARQALDQPEKNWTHVVHDRFFHL